MYIIYIISSSNSSTSSLQTRIRIFHTAVSYEATHARTLTRQFLPRPVRRPWLVLTVVHGCMTRGARSGEHWLLHRCETNGRDLRAYSSRALVLSLTQRPKKL